MKSEMGCEARVWDNGDTTDCGNRVLRHGLCARCLKSKIESLREEKKRLMDSLREVSSTLSYLQSESE